jgi:hypothetical protein
MRFLAGEDDEFNFALGVNNLFDKRTPVASPASPTISRRRHTTFRAATSTPAPASASKRARLFQQRKGRAAPMPSALATFAATYAELSPHL